MGVRSPGLEDPQKEKMATRSSSFFFLYVINRSFIGSKLEQTIRIVYRQYSVHTIKVKGIQNLYKTKHTGGKKIVQLKRDSGKILSIL